MTELVSKINQAPQWLDKVPCTFQSVFNDFVKLLSAAETFLAFFDIIPSLLVTLMGMYVLRKTNREAADESWKPMPLKILLVTYVIKILAPVGLYTFINFKLPVYSPYKDIGIKACQVTTSLVYYPPGSSAQYMAEEFRVFRKASSRYFANPENTLYQGLNDFETKLSKIDVAPDESLIDDGKSCRQADSDSKLYAALNVYFSPNNAIQNYCSEGFAAARNRGMTHTEAAEFPLLVVADHLRNVINGLSLTYPACKIMQKNAMFRVAVDNTISFTDVCMAFTRAEEYGDIDAKFKPYIPRKSFAKYSRDIDSLDNKDEKEAACMYAAGLIKF